MEWLLHRFQDDDTEEFEGFTIDEINFPQNVRQWGLTPQSLLNDQQNDADLGQVYQWIASGTSPSDQQLKASSPATRHYWLHKGQIVLINQLLYLKKPQDEPPKLLMPRAHIKLILKKLHDDPLSGHMGRDKTKKSVATRFYWFGMRGEINLYISNCHVCQRMKGPNQPAPTPRDGNSPNWLRTRKSSHRSYGTTTGHQAGKPTYIINGRCLQQVRMGSSCA